MPVSGDPRSATRVSLYLSPEADPAGSTGPKNHIPSPQQSTDPSISTPHETQPPAETEVKEPSGASASPYSLPPQQTTEPLSSNPHETPSPAETEVKEPLGTIVCPWSLSPQQTTPPSPRNPHACSGSTQRFALRRYVGFGDFDESGEFVGGYVPQQPVVHDFVGVCHDVAKPGDVAPRYVRPGNSIRMTLWYSISYSRSDILQAPLHSSSGQPADRRVPVVVVAEVR